MAELIDSSPAHRALAQRQQGDLEGAAKTLQQAIDGARRDLADLYGMLGGTKREQGDLVAAAQAYDAGFCLELRFHALSTYNALNRVVMRVLLAPGALSHPNLLRKEKRLEFVDVRRELSRIEKELRHGLAGVRSNDHWAAGDLAVAAALNGHLTRATEAVERFASCSPSPSSAAYDAYITTLAALAELDTRSKETLESVKILMKSKRD